MSLEPQQPVAPMMSPGGTPPAVRMFRSTFAIACFTFLSRITGFVRDVLMTAIVGAGASADAFFIAARIANLGRSLFAEGVLNAAFVPMFSRHLAHSGFGKAHAFANVILNWMLVILVALTVLVEILMPLVVVVFAPGFVEVAGKMEQTILFSRIAFPYLLLVSLVTLLSGALNSLGRFWVGAAAPILLNMVMIAALLLAIPYSGNPALLLSWCFPVAGVLQLAMLLVAARRAGIKWRLRLPKPDKQLRKLLNLMLPVALTGLIGWGTLIATNALASFEESAVSWLQYAGRLYNLPLGLIAISVGVVLLPELSRRLRNGEDAPALAAQSRALEFALLLTMPAAVILFLLPDVIIQFLFERARFGADDTSATAAALGVMALGLPGATVMHIFITAFYARQDTKTPLLYGAISNGVYVLTAFGFYAWLGYVGIALGGSLAAWSNAILLGVALHRRGRLVLDGRFLRRMLGLVISAAAMAAAVLLLHDGGLLAPLAERLGDGLLGRGAVLFVLIGASGLVYALACQLSGAAHWRELLALAWPNRSS